ncbi:M24 family metallopeptidase [Candidatus Protochlamydia phocaeensis]|uniref:M24 family metallopeptidase n=1 Tax=Candidatus Protochlamydia phocaeensis TaxID=1414722 RepID=UPI0008395383|nr:Xaa-Pro peptidase family protein [Candidatus Protochlamydia phocaeensis]
MDYSARLTRLRSLLLPLNSEAILIEHPTHLFYLTGLTLSAGKLLISQQDACLIVDGRYYESCSSGQTLYPVSLLKDASIKDWLADHRIQSLTFDSENTSYQAFLKLSKLAEELQPALSLIPAESPVKQMRLIKDEEEIRCLKQAAHLGYQGYEQVINLLRQGVKEAELAFELEFFWKKRGAQKLAFDSIIAFGVNSSMPHYRAGQTELQSGDHVLIDIGVVYQYYHSDMTRVSYFGTPHPTIQTIYSIVEEAQQKAFDLCIPGTPIGKLDEAARSFITSKGYGEHFTHSLGHGIGLDIHEPPTLRSQGPYANSPLQPGMVITIEPGIYLPGIGGVRLEDTILITDKGYENLTRQRR